MVSRILLALLFLTSTAHAQITLPNDEWQMISPESSEPVVLGDMFPDLFGDITLINGRNYVFYSYDTASKAYVKLDANTLLDVGQGFWGIQITGRDVVSDYVGTPLSGEIDLPIERGVWQMVGVPGTEDSQPVYLAKPTGGGSCTNTPCSFFGAWTRGYFLAPIYALEDGAYVRSYDVERKAGTAVWILGGTERDRDVFERHTGGE